MSGPAAPSTFLVWVPRGVPAGFAGAVGAMAKVGAITVVAEDDVWLRRSWCSAGELVDDPPPTYRIPIDAAAIDPESFAAFVPPADRARIASLAEGEAHPRGHLGRAPWARTGRRARHRRSPHPDRGRLARRAGRCRGAPRLDTPGRRDRYHPRSLLPRPPFRRPADDRARASGRGSDRSCRRPSA